jgi:beta-mannanase
MPNFKIKKKKVDEFVNADGGIISGDRNATNNSEIETGPVQKPFNDDSGYKKGISTTSDRASRYAQNIPWFAVYSYRGQSGRGLAINEKKNIIKKKELEEDLVKKSKKDSDIVDKNYDKRVEKIIDTIDDIDLSDAQLERIKQAIHTKLKK